MHRTPPFPFLSDLKMPIRDAMRGVANFAEATEEALEPASMLLPEPLRAGFQKAIKSIETTGKRFIDRPVNIDQIRAAAYFATGTNRDNAAAKDFAKVVCFAWMHLQNASKAPRFMISETIVTSKVAQIFPHETGAVLAAGLVETIRKSSAIGRLPGFADGVRADERTDIDMALVTIMIWLLSARAASVTEEFMLLDLAVVLVSANRCDIVAVMDDPAKVVDILHNISAHL
jgi:hypothetical protein